MITVLYKYFPNDVLMKIYYFKKASERNEAADIIISAYYKKVKRKLDLITNFLNYDDSYKKLGFYPITDLNNFMQTVVGMRILNKYEDFDWWVDIGGKLMATVHVYKLLSFEEKVQLNMNVHFMDIRLITHNVNILMEKFLFHHFGN